MGNCLVTQLKGTVDNDNLPIMGAGIFELPNREGSSYNDNILRIFADLRNESVITAEGGTFQIVESRNYKHLTELNVIAYSDKWADNAVYPDADSWTKIRYTVSNIYNIYHLEMGANVVFINGVSSLLDYGVLDTFIIRGGSIDLGSCKCGTLTLISATPGVLAKGNWYNIIENNSNLRILSLWDGRNELPTNAVNSSITNMSGFFGDLTSLPVTIESIKSDGLTGSLDNYVTRMRASGRTSDSIELILAQNSQMKLNNVYIPYWCEQHSITPNNYMYLVWTSNSITLQLTNPKA